MSEPMDMRDVFFSGETKCLRCKHLASVFRGTCEAFPDGIPTDVLNGDTQHDKPLSGDHDIQFEGK